MLPPLQRMQALPSSHLTSPQRISYMNPNFEAMKCAYCSVHIYIYVWTNVELNPDNHN